MTSKDAAKFTKPSDREVVMTKVFAAPRELVWKAYTDSKLIPRWWGPRYLTTTIDKNDAKPGGAWRFVSRGPDGNEFAFHGVYREVVKPERLNDEGNGHVRVPEQGRPRRDGVVRDGERRDREHGKARRAPGGDESRVSAPPIRGRLRTRSSHRS